ncbi:IclR family transcriptional regulator [Pedobacter zeae]|uniref:IclR family transcriptional regulator n=1 Tax=Pedobacter zeae TaxID=1737356 RepID=A0A7W6P4H6_9SPHI|nr:IclR family transcriptional regulator [Pedobacter zeae]MBB4106942.1 DNA-binding IclR family transcriptional regulator [Pedobacter zeae]GGH04716.1 IclR family transcriptional regulator [Pedobacter zeae]
MNEKESKYQAPALDKGLDILEYLSVQSIPLSQTEIAAGIGKTPNEIYRMLMSLECRGYILRDEVSGKYRLSLKLFYLSHRHSPIDELRKAAQLPLEELANTIHQSCHLSILYLNQAMVVIHAKSPGPIALSIEEGSFFPLPLTAPGKVLLAYLPDDERNTILRNNVIFKKYPKVQQEDFLASLQDIQQRGSYFKNSDPVSGITDLSVPVGITGNNRIVACLTISMLNAVNKEQDTKHDVILTEAHKCVKKIEERIGINPLCPNG